MWEYRGRGCIGMDNNHRDGLKGRLGVHLAQGFTFDVRRR